MKGRRRCLAGLLVLGLAPLARGAAGEAAGDWLRRAWDSFFAALRAHPPQGVAQARAMLERELLPLLDLDDLARRIVAEPWAQAMPAARAAFMRELRGLLLRRYAALLPRLPPLELRVLYTRRVAPDCPAGRRTERRPPRGEAQGCAEQGAEVYALAQGGRWRAPLRFALTPAAGGGWRIADVTVIAFSLARSLRAELLPELRQGGLSAATTALRTAG